VGNLVNQHVRFIEPGDRGLLMTYEKALITQSRESDRPNSRLIERKQMSTKTTFKRIALVAVAAVGFGTLSVAPTFAATTPIATSVPTVGKASQTVRVGDTATTTVGFTTAAIAAAADDQTYTNTTVTLTKPSASTVTLADNDGAGAGSTAAFARTGGTTNLLAAVDTASGAVTGDANTADVAAGAVVAGTVSIVPDAPGTYTVVVTTGATTTAVSTITVRSLSYTTGDAAAAAPYSTGTGVAGVANTVTVTGFASRATGVRALVTVSGSTILSGSNTPVISSDKLSATITAQSSSALVIATPAVGTITLNLYNETGNATGLFSTTASNTVTITVNAAALNGVYASSKAFISAGDDTAALPTADDATAISASATASTTAEAATIAVSQFDSAAVALLTAATKAITVEISGAGTLGLAANTPVGSYLAVAAAGGANSAADDFFVFPDGRSGVATITISVNGVLVATKKITFYGSVASYTLTVKNKAISVGSSTDTQVLTVAALDSKGVAVPSATVYVSSSSTATATVDATTVTTGADGTAADIGVNGVAKGDAVITVGNASSSATVSATGTISVVAVGIASVALSFDKVEYAPGEKATVTITAKNSDGVLSGDDTYATLFAAGGIISSSSLTTDMSAVSKALVNGVATYTVYMPLSKGTVSISATLGASVATDIQATAVSASATVLSDGVAEAAVDAAAEATDAANAATDAANAAAEAADAATAAAQDAADAVAALSVQVSEMVNALKKQITALTNLVIKIQKKVKA